VGRRVREADLRAVVTRVSRATVRIDGQTRASIGQGLLVLLGVGEGDSAKDADQLAAKVHHLRIFPDDHRPMNRALADVGGAILVVSQFTLLADTSRGRRPSFVRAAEPEVAETLYLDFVAALRRLGSTVETGSFGATMEVESVNDGPVTLLLSTDPEDGL
jgi:D-tyrosyl-tRNA(Tyr) deacylase